MSKKKPINMKEFFGMQEMKSFDETNNNTNNNNNINTTDNNNINANQDFSLKTNSKSCEIKTISNILDVKIDNKNINKGNSQKKFIKGDFFTDPELIYKNCELFKPETIKNSCTGSVIFNDTQQYKGVLVLTEFRLVFKEEKPIPFKLPKDYFKIPYMSISKAEKVQNAKIDYDQFSMELTLKDSRVIKFYVKDDLYSTFFLNLETYAFPKDSKYIYNFTKLYNDEINKQKKILNGWNIYDPKIEFSRMGIVEDGNFGLRFCDLNKDFKLCETYPEFLIVPKKITDSELKSASNYRSKNRLPILAYCYAGIMDEKTSFVPTIWRSAQNKGGIMGSKKNDSDINLIKTIKDMSKNLYIYDCRPKLNAMANRLNGGGFENTSHYDNMDLTFCEIENIHKARSAINSLYSLCLSNKINENYKFWNSVDSTGWFTFIYLLLKNADLISKLLLEGNSVLIHCSDGWDRTSQLSSLCQILLDPFYRTINGFAILVEKDWLSFGHQFGLRNGITKKNGSDDQSSPIFLQFLDAVHQLQLQYPNSFEFNEQFLLFLAKVHNLNLYGTFMFNNDKERKAMKAKETTVSVWTEIYKNYEPYLNTFYSSDSVKILEPNYAYYNIKLWTSFFMENNIYLRNERFFVKEDSEVYFSNVNDFYIYEKEADKKIMKEKDNEYKDLLGLASGLYDKIKDNEELLNSLDDKSKLLLEKIKNKLEITERLKKK